MANLSDRRSVLTLVADTGSERRSKASVPVPADEGMIDGGLRRVVEHFPPAARSADLAPVPAAAGEMLVWQFPPKTARRVVSGDWLV